MYINNYYKQIMWFLDGKLSYDDVIEKTAKDVAELTAQFPLHKEFNHEML